MIPTTKIHQFSEFQNTMKVRFVSAILIAVFCTTVYTQQTASPHRQFTAADYDRAVSMLGFNSNRLVDRLPGGPVWLEDGRFWYRVSTADGFEFVLVDPGSGNRKAASSLARKATIPG